MRSTDRKYRISQCECACCCLSRALTGRTFWKLSQLFLHVVTEKRSCVSNRFLPSFWKPASKSVKGYFYKCIHRFSSGFWTKLFSPSLSALFVVARFCYHVSGCRSIWFWTQNCHRVSQISLNFCRNAFSVFLSFFPLPNLTNIPKFWDFSCSPTKFFAKNYSQLKRTHFLFQIAFGCRKQQVLWFFELYVVNWIFLFFSFGFFPANFFLNYPASLIGEWECCILNIFQICEMCLLKIAFSFVQV